MEAETALRIGQEALLLALLISAPGVIAALLVGLAVSLFQAATQLQEQTLGFTLKIIVVYAVLAISGGWIIRELMRFTATLFSSMGAIAL